MIEIKFIPTGHIFSLPDDEAERIVKEDRGNYEVIKGKIKEEKAPKTAKSVQELVVVNDKEKQKEVKTETKTDNKSEKTEKTEKTKEKENK
ncbi:hypothetical protein IJ818_06460 [bacterium]|nr:hypothetical protein [bacterium]